MVAANNTYINSILELNKFENIYKEKERYPEVTIDNIKNSKNLELILLSSEPFPFQEKHIKELKQKSIIAKTIIVDGEMFSWHGSRLIKAFDYFINLRNNI